MNNNNFMIKPLIGLIILVVVTFIVGNILKDKKLNTLEKTNYTMYIKNDALIEISFYEECLNKKCNIKVDDILFIDSNAKNKYQEESLYKTDSIDTLLSKILDIANNKNDKYYFEIYTDYTDISSLITSIDKNKILYNELNKLDLSKIDNKTIDKIDS